MNKYKLIWKWAIYKPITLIDLIKWYWELDWVMFEDRKENHNMKWDRVSLPAKDYRFWADHEGDYWVWEEVKD